MSTKKLQILDYNVKQADNADTVDGKHADEFASTDAMITAQSDISDLQTKVGDTAVSTQITAAINAIDYPVDSVNGKTGSVELTASDVGALPSTTTIPSIDGLATETYVDNKVAGIVNSAPETLDTLNELAAALGNDPNFATTVATQIGTKVDKVSGKGLSTNDYTTAEKNKLAGIAAGANKTTVDSAFSSTSTNPVQNKVVNSAINNLNTLVGDTAVSTQITNAVANKVDKVSGKGLSTNDYTTTEKNKLAGIAAGATANSASATTPKAAGTASVGSETAYARGDHVHPAQTTVSGNSGSSTKLATARTIQTNLESTSSASFDGTSDITPGVTGALPIANGGTGATTASNALTKLGGAKVDLTNVTNTNFLSKAQASGASVPVVTTSGSGNAYTATVPGVAEIKPGVMFVMIPHTDSTDIKPTLNVNNLGNYVIGRHASSPTNYRVYGNSSDWLHKGIPVLIMFGSIGWVVLDDTKPSGDDLAGTVPISSGGTGATTAASARTNLGIANSDIVDLIYPVGSIYMSVNKTSPETLFGGTWEKIAGKFLVGVGNGFVVGDSGGSMTHTHTTGDHTLTTDEMPYHYHNIWYPNSGGPTTSEIGYPTTGAKNTWCANACHTDGQGGGEAHNHGDTGSASNLPPYLAVWIWKRTA